MTLLGTAEQVRLAAQAASGQGGAGMAAGGMLGVGAGRPAQDADSPPGPDARKP